MHKIDFKTICLSAAVAATVMATSPALAQTDDGQGYTRIQGRPVEEIEEAPVLGTEVLIDMREEMRRFVQSISMFARKHRPNFLVIAQGGLDLLVKQDAINEELVSAARTYIRSIDGVLVEGLFYGQRLFGQPPIPESQLVMLQRAEAAKRHGLKVFVMDFSTDQTSIDDSYLRNAEMDYISLAVQQHVADIDTLPTYPERPINENPNSVVAINGIRNYAFIANSSPFGRADQFALKMHDTNYDMIIVDVFHGRKPLSKRAVETLKFKKIGARRLVLAYMDIGSAASYQYFWKANWREGSPGWINAPLRDDPDRYHVQYWRPGWQQVINGNTDSYLYGIIAQGFDGVVLGGVDTYKFFEGGEDGEELQEAAQ